LEVSSRIMGNTNAVGGAFEGFEEVACLLPPIHWAGDVRDLDLVVQLYWESGRERNLDLGFWAEWRAGSGFWS
jgi:hypothetical protein